jgi:hypothetical protein
MLAQLLLLSAAQGNELDPLAAQHDLELISGLQAIVQNLQTA